MITLENINLAVQSQFKDTNVEGLLRDLESIYNRYVVKSTESLFNDNLNITTAKEDGLDGWGYLLHFSRFIPGLGEEPENIQFFNFNDKNFINLQFFYDNESSYLRLEDYYFRRFLVLIYQSQFILNNIPEVNRFMEELFEDLANVTIKDSYNMQFIVYLFNTTHTQALPEWFKYVLTNYDILLRPAGVGVKWEETNYKYFGFKTEVGEQDPMVGNFNKTIFKG